MYLGKQCLVQSAVSKSLAMMVDVQQVGKTYCKHFKESTWVVERGKFYDPVRSLLKSKNQETNRLQLAVKLPWAIFFESVDILS
ncbi:hypothetical protein TNCV_1915061 [Trichonephila clavipes]|uniref:Uncharacterized protein n=1 Tax=Trichonephila clavipes TaxID=2585209 RepID=A0A8X7BB87_TRICX|nr:hypothetical protein TNCV_1915061 [Trichonephila clavipes]